MSPSSALSGYATLQTPTFATSLTVDWSKGDMCQPGVMTANSTLTFINASRGQIVSLVLTQDTTGGRTVTFPANIIGGTVPQPTVAPNATTAYRFRFDGINYVYEVANLELQSSSGTVHFVQKKITTGHYALNKASTTTWYELDSTNLRCTLNAVTGDLIVFYAHFIWGLEAPYAIMEAASIVSGSPVNWWGAGNAGGSFGIPSLYGPSGIQNPVSCSLPKVLVSGDISGGQVTVSPFIRIGTANTNKYIYADATLPTFIAIENKGQVVAP